VSDERLDAAVAEYRARGFASLGKVIDDASLERLRARCEAIMRGEHDPSRFFFQHDSPSNQYGDLEYGAGWIGPSPRYRKVEKLERDEVFLAHLRSELFERIARRVIGEHVTLYRATLFNKAADGSSEIPWHQDAGSYWGLDRDPELQIWTALDDAPAGAGCLELIPESHAGGLATPLGGAIPADVVARNAARARAVLLPAVAGEVVLIHNHVWHRSGSNRSGKVRRAFTACLMDGATRCTRKKREPRQFFTVFTAPGRRTTERAASRAVSEGRGEPVDDSPPDGGEFGGDRPRADMAANRGECYESTTT
jgi:ectoine hydroxylase-related dioxygenase (phytanoyl-CoA dioxygenase family)